MLTYTDVARSTEMLALFSRLFGPYPYSRYTMVVTDDDLEIPLEAQGIAVFGANHVDGRGGSERLVAHELAHQRQRALPRLSPGGTTDGG